MKLRVMQLLALMARTHAILMERRLLQSSHQIDRFVGLARALAVLVERRLLQSAYQIDRFVRMVSTQAVMVERRVLQSSHQIDRCVGTCARGTCFQLVGIETMVAILALYRPVKYCLRRMTPLQTLLKDYLHGVPVASACCRALSLSTS